MNRVLFRFVAPVLVLWVVWLAPARSDGSNHRFTLLERDEFELDVSRYRGLRLRTRDPVLTFRVGGRLHLDGHVAEDDATAFRENDFDVRRARLYLRGKSENGFSFVLDGELAERRRGWRNLAATYSPSRSLSLRVGNFVAPFGLEEVATSNYSTFLERSIASSIAPGFQTGVRLVANGHIGEKKNRHRWVVAAAWTMEPLGEGSNDRRRTRHDGFVSRLVYAPLASSKRGVLHFGANFEYRKIRDDRRWRLATRPEAGLLPSLLSTGSLADVEDVVNVGAELVAIRGPWTIQSEYFHSHLRRSGGRNNPSFSGGYIQASWIVTGETRRYRRRSATNQGIRPESRFGAVELGVRFSALDLNDETVNGGSARNLTVGASWYLMRNMRLMANYTYADLRTRSTRDEDRIHVAQFRWLVFF